jgi:hypothetical protein
MRRGLSKLSDEEIKKDISNILEGSYPGEAEATLGENRGQLFVRIPKIVSQRMNLKKGDVFVFKVSTKSKKSNLEVHLKK